MKWFAIFCALFVALCWGLYGPTLSNARSPAREWGPFKPYLFIGVAYFAIAIVGGSLMMKFVFSDNFNYSGKYFPAMQWGFFAGCLGALGALGLTFALTRAGGKPAYVMPIVFGGAVTVNAIAAYFLVLQTGEKTNPLMWVGMVLVAIGIVLTAGYTPHAHPPAKHVAGHESASEQAAGESGQAASDPGEH